MARLRRLAARILPSSRSTISAGHAYGCDYCADQQNRLFGHVTQLASSDERMTLLLGCPRCHALYEISTMEDDARRLTTDEARELFPGSV
jgi:hypothetical protein